ncbi:MAG: acyl-CoA ligase (AMP-forming), exosortase A system-associated [Pseudomonadota bacterium]
MSELVHDVIFSAACRTPAAPALAYGAQRLDYAALAQAVDAAAQTLLEAGIGRGERVAVYLEKRIENVAACFGATAAGAVFVPVNPLLKPEQVAYILADCNVRILVTSSERLRQLAAVLPNCPDLHTVLVVGGSAELPGITVRAWAQDSAGQAAHRVIDTDMAAILYTSGSTGNPKGVVLSHRNLVAGALSVASYLELSARDRVLAVLPLSFDYGLSQLTSAFHAGASVVLINYLFPRDIVKAVADEAITGLAAVPPLWIQLAQLAWPASCTLRYLTNSGGAMPLPTVAALRAALPDASLFLMYGLTEAFRSTYLPPSELARRPDSMGRAIPNAEVLVVRPDGTLCDDDEPGELVHRGALVALGYWNDAERTAERFRPAPGQDPALPMREIAVWSGDTVRRDAQGFLYFIGRSDDMIKVSGYRISPSEIEEAVHAAQLVAEVAAFGVPHPVLGQAVVLLAVARAGDEVTPALLQKECQRRLPAYMVPAHIDIRSEAFPRNPNGKIDRKLLRQSYLTLFESSPP